MKKEEAIGSKYTEDLQLKLTPETRKIILEIKSFLTNSRDYKVKFKSTGIYEAVVDNNITTVEDFLKHMAQN